MNIMSCLPLFAGMLVALGQFLLKKNLDGLQWGANNAKSLGVFVYSALLNPSFVLALVVMFSGSIFYLISLRFVPFSRAVPLAAGMILASSIVLGKLFLHEDITLYRMLGIGFILIGIFFISVRQ